MTQDQQKAKLRTTFDAVAGGYDSPALRFFRESARIMSELLELKGTEAVLDVATGTGNAALAIAPLVPQGKVVGIDFSPGMIEQARRKAAMQQAGNVEFRETDMQAMAFPASSFDVAVCAFGIFFVDDMAAQLRRIAGLVKPGGRIMISGFRDGSFAGLADLMFARLKRYEVKAPDPGWKRIATPAGCRELFAEAGLADVNVEGRNVGYFLDSEGWWEIIWNAGFRGLVGQLSPEDLEQFRYDHLREVKALGTEEGIWLEVGVLFTAGRKR